MTSIATVAGAVPLMLATGAGAAARTAIGVVIVLGVAISTLITLFLIPLLYSRLARFTGSPLAVTRRLEGQLGRPGHRPAEPDRMTGHRLQIAAQDELPALCAGDGAAGAAARHPLRAAGRLGRGQCLVRRARQAGPHAARLGVRRRLDDPLHPARPVARHAAPRPRRPLARRRDRACSCSCCCSTSPGRRSSSPFTRSAPPSC